MLPRTAHMLPVRRVQGHSRTSDQEPGLFTVGTHLLSSSGGALLYTHPSYRYKSLCAHDILRMNVFCGFTCNSSKLEQASCPFLCELTVLDTCTLWNTTAAIHDPQNSVGASRGYVKRKENLKGSHCVLLNKRVARNQE